MKPRMGNQKTAALTLVEVVVVIAVVVVFVAFLWPTLGSHRGRVQHDFCVNNLKQVGLAYRMWSADNNDKYPMALSTAEGGTLELMSGPDAWKTYLVLSNQLYSPKIVFCPQDREHQRAATNFSDDLKNHVSYFIGSEATADNEHVFLSGDDHFLINGIRARSGLIEVTSNTPIAWDSSRHFEIEAQLWLFSTKAKAGYIGMGDGSVEIMKTSDLLNRISQTGLATNRLAIP